MSSLQNVQLVDENKEDQSTDISRDDNVREEEPRARDGEYTTSVETRKVTDYNSEILEVFNGFPAHTQKEFKKRLITHNIDGDMNSIQSLNIIQKLKIAHDKKVARSRIVQQQQRKIIKESKKEPPPEPEAEPEQLEAEQPEPEPEPALVEPEPEPSALPLNFERKKINALSAWFN